MLIIISIIAKSFKFKCFYIALYKVLYNKAKTWHMINKSQTGASHIKHFRKIRKNTKLKFS